MENTDEIRYDWVGKGVRPKKKEEKKNCNIAQMLLDMCKTNMLLRCTELKTGKEKDLPEMCNIYECLWRGKVFFLYIKMFII